MTTEIYPIYLNDLRAKELVNKYALTELTNNTLWHTENAVYDYTAKINANGDVDLSVSFSDDNGFMMSGGSCLRKTIHPFSDEEIKSFEEHRKIEIATKEFWRIVDEENFQKIMAIKAKLFGE